MTVPAATSTRPREAIWAKLQRSYARDGVKGIVSQGLGRLVHPVRSRWRRWRYGDNWLLGKLVELRGNRYHADGLTFTLDNPRILTRLKSRFHRGDYERGESELLARHLDPALPIVEIGACIGVVACLTNRKLAVSTNHVVVEANPYLIPTLEQNRDANGCGFTILNRALAYGAPAIDFSIHELFVGGSVQRPTGETISVPATTLAQIVEEFRFDHITLVFDAEGAEVELLEHDLDTLATRVAWLFMELHERIVGSGPIERTRSRLLEAGFELVETVDNDNVVYRNTRLDHASSPATNR